jgi:hypothetical protein
MISALAARNKGEIASFYSFVVECGSVMVEALSYMPEGRGFEILLGE